MELHHYSETPWKLKSYFGQDPYANITPRRVQPDEVRMLDGFEMASLDDLGFLSGLALHVDEAILFRLDGHRRRGKHVTTEGAKFVVLCA